MSNKQQFISMLAPYAQEASSRTGIDPRIIIAQAAQETGWGRSAPGNNYFGIKSHGKGGGQNFTTHEVINGQRVKIQDNFRSYSNPGESALGYADFINKNPRYEKFKSAQGLDAQVAELGRSGYATDPDYANSIGQIARSINLPSPQNDSNQGRVDVASDDAGVEVAQTTVDPQQWQPVHDAFLSGRMSPEQQATYQSGLKSGEIPKAAAPRSIIEAYQSGQMTAEQTAQFDAAVSAGIWAAPEQAAVEAETQEPRTFGDRVLRGLGLTARAVGEGGAGLIGLVSDPIAALINATPVSDWTNTEKMRGFRESVSSALTQAGVPEPENTAERIVQAATQAVVGGGGVVAGARGVASVASSPVTTGAAQQLAAQPLAQLTGAGASGAAGQTAAELGAGPVTQVAASLGGGIAGSRLAAGRVPTGVSKASEIDDIAAGDAAGIRTLTSDLARPESFTAKGVQRIGERIPIAGTGGIRAAQQTERVNAIRKLASRFGATSIDDMSDELVADLIGTRKAAIDKLVTAKREVINGAAGTVPVKRTVDAINTEISKQDAIGTKGSRIIADKLLDWRKNITDKPLAVIDDIRSEMGQAFEGDDMASVKNAANKVLKKIYGPIKADMGEFIKDTSGTPAFNKWNVTNTKLSKMIGEVENTGLKAVLKRGEANPETIYNMLKSPNRSNVKSLFKGLSPEGRDRARSAIIWKMTRDGDLEKSPEKFVSEVNKMGNAVGVFFGPRDKAAIKGLERALRTTRRASDAAVVTNSGQQTAQTVGAAALSGVAGATGNLPVLAGIPIAGLLARAYESAPVRNMLIKLAQQKTGSAEEAALVKRIIAAAQSYDQGDQE